MKFSHLCIGGPLDGHKMDSTSSHGFTAPVMKPLAFAMPMDAPPNATIDEVQYVRMLIQADNDVVITVWVPNGQTATETFDALFDCYERNKLHLKRIGAAA